MFNKRLIQLAARDRKVSLACDSIHLEIEKMLVELHTLDQEMNNLTELYKKLRECLK